MAGVIRQQVLDSTLKQHPEHRQFLDVFLNGFYVTWGRARKTHNTMLFEYFLSPEDFMKELFGFDQEVLLIYAPYARLEPRTLLAAEKIINSDPASARVEKYCYILITDAENPQEWLDAYYLAHGEKRVTVAFNTAELISSKGEDLFIREKLRTRLHGRDLFDNRLPILDDVDFYGRTNIVMDVFDSLRRSENRGIFGLRKTGKTSLLYKIKRVFENSSNLGYVFIMDAKRIEVRSLRWYELLKRLGSEIALRLEQETSILTLSNPVEIVEEFTSIVQSSNGKKIVIAIDEIEYITPKSLTDHHWKMDFIDMWQYLWSLQSDYRNISYIIVGVNPYIVEVDAINGIQNPLFGIVSSTYLTGFEYQDVKTMVRTLGKRMGLKFEFDTYEYLYENYGGHPLLTRLACSFIHRDVDQKQRKRPATLTLDYLKDTESQRDTELVFYCRHVVSELKQFYPDEYNMLEILAKGQISDFVELDPYPEFTRHIYSYGLVKKNEKGYPVFLIRAVKRYIGSEWAIEHQQKTVYQVVPQAERRSWLELKKESIVRDLRQFERLLKQNHQEYFFGITSFPEADRFARINVVSNEDEFQVFINTMNRCFVESVEAYGKHIGKPNYFWEDIQELYPSLHYALDRIKTYRVDQFHLQLTNHTNRKLARYTNTDLEGEAAITNQDKYFRLQQATMDGMLAAINIEISKIDT